MAPPATWAAATGEGRRLGADPVPSRPGALEQRRRRRHQRVDRRPLLGGGVVDAVQQAASVSMMRLRGRAARCRAPCWPTTPGAAGPITSAAGTRAPPPPSPSAAPLRRWSPLAWVWVAAARPPAVSSSVRHRRSLPGEGPVAGHLPCDAATPPSRPACRSSPSGAGGPGRGGVRPPRRVGLGDGGQQRGRARLETGGGSVQRLASGGHRRWCARRASASFQPSATTRVTAPSKRDARASRGGPDPCRPARCGRRLASRGNRRHAARQLAWRGMGLPTLVSKQRAERAARSCRRSPSARSAGRVRMFTVARS